ncbi:MAG: FAD-dependent oxidoreductase [Caulobacteraceae bacterium]|nr:FAD-dependent oxidoreductase [Caulobacteraceae bacterium]
MVEIVVTDCCIAGGGPAGMMAGFILARAGVAVTVLEKHADFFRDFRGDTVHPSTMEAMSELGLLERFLQRPHDEVDELSAQIGEAVVKIADFRHLPTKARFIALMPQWDFLDFLRQEGRSFPALDVRMQTEARDLIMRDGRVAGVLADGPQGPLEIEAQLVVAADGRHSALRERAGLRASDLGAPIDVLWMRLPRRPDDPEMPLGRMDPGRFLVMINRGDYFQCAFVTPKGGYDAIRAAGLPAFREQIAATVPAMRDRVEGLKDWDDVKLLTVTVDRLEQWWRPGLLCIGDAAHAMSPVGGVGVNLAVQDAVAAGNALAGPLLAHRVEDADLAQVQKRRETPVRRMQAIQMAVHRRVLKPVLAAQAPLKVPLAARVLNAIPLLRRLPARIVGLGFGMEHVRAPEARPRPAAD